MSEKPSDGAAARAPGYDSKLSALAVDQARQVTVGGGGGRGGGSITAPLSVLSTLLLAASDAHDDDVDISSPVVEDHRPGADMNPDESLRRRHDLRPARPPPRTGLTGGAWTAPRSLPVDPARRPRRPPPCPPVESWMRVCRVTMSRRGAAYSHSGHR